jgi:hypothetical protein
MNIQLYACSIRNGALTIAVCLVALTMTCPLFGQSNPCAEPLKEGIYNHYKAKTSVHKFSSMKDYFRSNDFEQDVKKGSWGGGITIPIYGVPVGVNANSTNDNFKEFRHEIEKLSENQLDEALAKEVEKSEPNTEFTKQYFNCISKGFSWSVELVGGRAFFSIRYVPISTSDPMPVLTDDVRLSNATDELVHPKKGDTLDFFTQISAAPQNPEKQVIVEMYTNKGSVYAFTALPKSPTPPPPTPTATPDRERLLELIKTGHTVKFGHYIAPRKYVSNIGGVGNAQKYLSECAALLHEINHPAAGQVDVWANQGDIHALADAVNCTDDKILEPLAKKQIIGQPQCDNNHQHNDIP